MKPFFLVLSALFISVVSAGQSIVDTANLWNNSIIYESPFGVLATESIRFGSDTVINSVTYKKVLRSLEEFPATWSSYGFIREEPGKRVFYKGTAADPEKLLYDLSLGLDDSVQVFGLSTFNNIIYFDTIIYHVTGIDSLEVGAGYKYRLRLSVRDYAGQLVELEQWTDSMGSMSGMLHNRPMLVGYDSYNLLCYSRNGELQYRHEGMTTCYLSTGIEANSTPDGNVSASFDPSSGTVLFRVHGTCRPGGFFLALFNTVGSRVFSSEVPGEFRLPVNGFPAGLYLYTVTCGPDLAGFGKILVW